jgi:arylsulfatase A-like enzyme
LKALGSRASQDLATCHLNSLETLGSLGSERGPKFVFAHFLPPHHPYLFDRQGHVLRHASLSDQFEFQKLLWEARQPYVDQLIFMNERILRVIDRLRADSAQEPIIVLQSDHGPNLRDGLTEERQHQIRFANFAAFLLPGAPGDLVPDDGTPVNHFRRIFNHYFGTSHEILADRYFVSPFGQPYAFKEVDRAGAPVSPPR